MEKETASALLAPILAPASTFAAALRDRVRGWWEADLADAVPGEGDLSFDRFTLARWLWGEGHLLPGGDAHVTDLVASAALGPHSAILDISAGLGGGPRAIAQAYDLYVTGLDRDYEAARRGMAASEAAGLAKRAAIARFDPDEFELKPASFDCVLGREATYALQEKERFLRGLVQGLKPRAQLVLTEFTLASTDATLEVEAWIEGNDPRPSLWSLAQYADCLAALACPVQAAEDMTESYRRLVVSAWERLLDAVDLKRLSAHHRETVAEEAERGLRLVAALDSGALRFHRFLAIADKEKG